jgi:hypothetical protein
MLLISICLFFSLASPTRLAILHSLPSPTPSSEHHNSAPQPLWIHYWADYRTLRWIMIVFPCWIRGRASFPPSSLPLYRSINRSIEYPPLIEHSSSFNSETKSWTLMANIASYLPPPFKKQIYFMALNKFVRRFVCTEHPMMMSLGGEGPKLHKPVWTAGIISPRYRTNHTMIDESQLNAE